MKIFLLLSALLGWTSIWMAPANAECRIYSAPDSSYRNFLPTNESDRRPEKKTDAHPCSRSEPVLGQNATSESTDVNEITQKIVSPDNDDLKNLRRLYREMKLKKENIESLYKSYSEGLMLAKSELNSDSTPVSSPKETKKTLRSFSASLLGKKSNPPTPAEKRKATRQDALDYAQDEIRKTKKSLLNDLFEAKKYTNHPEFERCVRTKLIEKLGLTPSNITLPIEGTISKKSEKQIDSDLLSVRGGNVFIDLGKGSQSISSWYSDFVNNDPITQKEIREKKFSLEALETKLQTQ